MGLSQCGLDVCFSDGYIGRMLLFMKSLPLCAVIETVPHSLVLATRMLLALGTSPMKTEYKREIDIYHVHNKGFRTLWEIKVQRKFFSLTAVTLF